MIVGKPAILLDAIHAPLIRLFREVSGDVPDEVNLARMRWVSSALNLRDNDALWSMIAVLEYYARLYEAMPERIRWASEGSLEAARREVGGETDTLMRMRCHIAGSECRTVQ